MSKSDSAGERPVAAAPLVGGCSGRRRLRLTVTVLAAVLVLALSVVFGGYAYYNAKLTRVPIPGLGQVSRSVVSAPPSAGENFLLVGSDTRAFAGGQAFQAPAGSADFVAGARSDTVILLHLPIGGARPTIVSFPRDTYVQIPAFTDRPARPPRRTRPSSTRRSPSADPRCSPSSSNSSPGCAWITMSRSTSGGSAALWTLSGGSVCASAPAGTTTTPRTP